MNYLENAILPSIAVEGPDQRLIEFANLPPSLRRMLQFNFHNCDSIAILIQEKAIRASIPAPGSFFRDEMHPRRGFIERELIPQALLDNPLIFDSASPGSLLSAARVNPLGAGAKLHALDLAQGLEVGRALKVRGRLR